MVESLWNTADDYLAAILLAEMGPNSSYQTLKINSVQVWAQYDPIYFEPLPRPFSIVTSYESFSDVSGIGQDGRGRIGRQITYIYRLVSVCDGTLTQASKDAKTLHWRQEDLLSRLRFADVASIDGSAISSILKSKGNKFLAGGIHLWERSTSGSDNMYGLAVSHFALTGATA